MKRFIALLLIMVAIFGCHFLKKRPIAENISLMTFNIRYGTANDGDNRWELREPILMACLRRYHPDLLCTQEALNFQIQAIQKNMTEYGVFGKGRYFNTEMPTRPQESMDGESCRIFYNKQKFELLKEATFWHSEQPEVPASISWGNSLPRIVTWGLFRSRTSGKEFVLMNTHFHGGEPYVSRTTELILKKWFEIAQDRPTLFSGDFNLAPTSETHAQFCGDKSMPQSRRLFYDVWQTLGKSEVDAGTGHGFKAGKHENRIDWILCTKEFTAKDVQIIYYNQDNRYPSDHYPVMAEIQF